MGGEGGEGRGDSSCLSKETQEQVMGGGGGDSIPVLIVSH